MSYKVVHMLSVVGDASGHQPAWLPQRRGVRALGSQEQRESQMGFGDGRHSPWREGMTGGSVAPTGVAVTQTPDQPSDQELKQGTRLMK